MFAKLLKRIAFELQSLFGRKTLEENLDEEIRLHLEEMVEDLIAGGKSPEEARNAAMREFGNVEGLKEECRDSWGMRFVETLFRHLRIAGRQMIRKKGFTAVVVLTLGLGIGVNTAIYSLAKLVIFQPLSFPNADQLVAIDERTDQISSLGVSYPNFRDWQERQNSFSAIGVSRNGGFSLIGPDSSERINGVRITHEYLEVLKVAPLIGRLFSAEDDHPGAEPTALIGERLWRNRFGAKDSIIGETKNLTGQLYTIIGVLPAIYPIESRDVWTPLGLIADKGVFPDRDNHPGLRAIARIKPGIKLDQARSNLERIAADLAVEYPNTNAGHTVTVESLQDRLYRPSKPPLVALLGASGFLLLIACANVANMQLVSSQGRRHEFGIRVSLGANRRQILGQLVVECLTLGLAGGAAGILIALGSIEWLKTILENVVPRIGETGIDGSALAYAAAMSIASSFLFGLAPLRQAMRLSQKEAISLGSRSSESQQGKKWKAVLIVGEFALTSALLVGAGLMIRTTDNLYKSSPGFQTDQRFTFSWTLSGTEYSEAEKRIQTVERAQEKLNGLPEVSSVSVVNPLPLSGSGNGTVYYVEGTPLPAPGKSRSTERIVISHTYFETTGIRLIAGRLFNDFDKADTQRVAIVDKTFVERNFPNEDPIGKRFINGRGPPSDPKFWKQIVGVVEHVKMRGLSTSTREQMYLPIRQSTPRDYSFVLKTKGDPNKLNNAVRKTLFEIDSSLPVYHLSSFDSLFDDSVSRERLLMQLLGVLAALALLLAAVGIYGVLSYTVGQQQREIGIRMAVGANRGSIRNLILSNGAKLAGAGLTIGFLASLGLSRLLSGMLYGVSTFDGASFGAVVIVLGVVGLIACWLPAHRATRIAPSFALRGD